MKNVCEYYDGKNVQYTFEEMETNSILLFDSQEIPALQSTDIKEIPVDDEKNWQLCYPMCRKTPSFSYGDIRHFHRIYVSN